MELQELYNNRFKNEGKKRNDIWRVLCSSFFQKLIPENHIVLDIAAGRCEFINNINASKKYAFDLNPAVLDYADSDVNAFNASCFDIADKLHGKNADTIFISNFFEHLDKKEDIIKVLHMCYDILSKDGQIIILQPNIKYVREAYWDFIDHKLALTDSALIEAGEISGLKVKKLIRKFLPYTTKSKLPQAPWIVWLYLKLMPFSGNFGGGAQSLIILEKKDVNNYNSCL